MSFFQDQGLVLFHESSGSNYKPGRTFDFEVGLGDDAVDVAGVLAHVGQGRVGDDELVHEALVLDNHFVLLALEDFLRARSGSNL